MAPNISVDHVDEHAVNTLRFQRNTYEYGDRCEIGRVFGGRESIRQPMTIPRTEAMGKLALMEAFQGISIHVGKLIE